MVVNYYEKKEKTMNSNHLQVGMCYDSFKNLYSSPVVDLSEGLLRFVLPIDNCTTEEFTVNLKRIIEKQKEKWKFHYTEKTFNQYLNAYYQIPFKTAINMHGEQQIQYTLQV